MARTAPTTARPPSPASRWKRVQDFLRGLAVLLSILGGAALVGGGLIFLWVADLREFATAVLGVGGILLLLALASSFVPVKTYLTGQRGRYAMNAVLMVLVSLAIAALLNFISFRNPVRVDTTFTRHFTLAPQTLEVLETLKEPVRATAFFTPARSEQEAGARQRAEDLLSEFQRRSGRKFAHRFEDPERDPATAAQYGVTEYPVIVFEALDSQRRFPLLVPPLAEQDLTSALLVVTGARQKVVYFLTGHGEKDATDLDGNSVTGFGFAARGVFADNYGARPLNLAQLKKVPEDAAVLVLAGPTKDLLSEEREELSRWLKAGGRAVFLVDPGVPFTFRELLAQWSVQVGPMTVVDLGSAVHQAPRTPLLQRSQYLRTLPVTKQLDVTFLPNATPIDLSEEFLKDPRKIPPWVQYSPLALSTPASFATEDPQRETFRQGVDKPGPHTLALAFQACDLVTTETMKQEARERLVPGERGQRCLSADGKERAATSVVVFGDSEFANNRNFFAYTNGDFFLNAINWLAQEYELISIRPKPFAFRELVVTTSEFNFMRYASWFLLPATVALLGLLVWWRRR